MAATFDKITAAKVGSPGSALDDLKWIDDEVNLKDSKPPDNSEFQQFTQKTIANTVFKKMSENLLVPLGLAATVTCLTMGLVSMNRGDSKRQQLFMRGRVGFQAFTFIAMASTLYLTANRRKK